mgnify:CR=1 FL=1
MRSPTKVSHHYHQRARTTQRKLQSAGLTRGSLMGCRCGQGGNALPAAGEPAAGAVLQDHGSLPHPARRLLSLAALFEGARHHLPYQMGRTLSSRSCDSPCPCVVYVVCVSCRAVPCVRCVSCVLRRFEAAARSRPRAWRRSRPCCLAVGCFRRRASGRTTASCCPTTPWLLSPSSKAGFA